MSLLFNGLGGALKGYREERGLTRREAAKAAGVSPASWGNWERGTTPQPHMLPKILMVLGCTEAELWHQKTEIEREHYRSLLPQQDAMPEIEAGLAGTLARIEALNLEGLGEVEQQFFALFKQTAGEEASLLSSLISAMQQILTHKEKP